MEIFFDEISHFLTRFGGLRHSDWSIQWSYDEIMRFGETLGLRRLENWSSGKSYSKETPKSHFLWDLWRFGLKWLLKVTLNWFHFWFHFWNHVHNSANTQSILTKLLLKVDIKVPFCLHSHTPLMGWSKVKN